MPTFRKLHTKILDSYDFAEMPNDFTRVLWMLLPLVADSEGRAIDNPAWLRSKMFPLRDDVKLEDIESALSWLADRQMIVRYEVDGRGYFYISKFKTYQTGTEKEAKSVLPKAPDLLLSGSRVTQEQVDVAASASASASVNASESESESGEIFKSYEREIGIISPVISDDIVDMLEDGMPAEYFIRAFQEAAKNNKRSWAYAKAILKRYKVEGVTQVSAKEKRLEGKHSIQLPDGQIVEATL